MRKLIIVLGIILVIGLGTGTAVMAGRMVDLEAQSTKGKLELQSKTDALAKLESQLARLESANSDLSRQLDELRQKPLAQTTPPTVDTPGTADPNATLEGPPPAEPSELLSSLITEQLEQTSRSAERQVERGERREEWRQEFQTRIDEAFATEYANAPDAAAKDRVQAIQEYVAYTQQLRESMRNAQTDEEREQLGQQMRDAFRTMGGLIEEHQTAKLEAVASQYGITDPNQQAAFLEALDNARSNPLMRMGGMRGGFGGGAWGGRGGGDNGGGGPRGGSGGR